LGKKNAQRVRLEITGIVQGVGFRPFIFGLARDLDIQGVVYNIPSGIVVDVEGSVSQLTNLLRRIQTENPEHSYIHSCQSVYLDPLGYTDFKIGKSDSCPGAAAFIPPDLATCASCREEIFNPADRRYQYPFTNCTHCGPRYSIIKSLPYDRENTSMNPFDMCGDCRQEYEDPANRRFHAQPNACPACGPHMELWDHRGGILEFHQGALAQAVKYIKEGKVVAVKGIGGFHLMVDAYNESAVYALRKRKSRGRKPFAVMFPSGPLVGHYCDVSCEEQALLESSQSPIVLLQRKERIEHARPIAPSVAPGNPSLGVMLPYSPLHHLLMREFQGPMVATSGNLSEEPICTDEHDALERLQGIADYFLVHNRPIVRSVDDSVMRLMMGRPLMIRRSRGYAPLPVLTGVEGRDILAVGGHLKNSIGIYKGKNVILSQHIGDLETEPSFQAFREAIKALCELYAVHPSCIVCDAHPEYLSTTYAEQSGLPLVKVQHHHAHVVSCMSENQIDDPVLGLAWDGTGYGTDQTIWGGEFLLSTLDNFTRAGFFYPFKIPGGERAVREPRRLALGLLAELNNGDLNRYADLMPVRSFRSGEIRLIQDMLHKGVQSPRTTSVGRLFDGVAAILGLTQTNQFEGQAACALEHIIQDFVTDDSYEYAIEQNTDGCYIVDWRMMVAEMIEEVRSNIMTTKIAAKFHNTLVEMAVDVAKYVGNLKVVLSGGCFQNKYLTERMIARLRQEHFQPYWHQMVPPNDGGIALGQAVVGALQAKEKGHR